MRVHGRFDARMENGIELREFCMVGENDRAEFFAVNGTVGAKNVLSEFINDGLVRGLTALDELMAERVRVENVKAEFAELRCDPTFAAGDSSGEAESFHKFIGRANSEIRHYRVAPTAARERRRRAALTVLLMSMVMVMGPTPPGTGVRAPAVLTASG